MTPFGGISAPDVVSRESPSTRPTTAPVPYTLVAELTHRCPLKCVYCSNPVELGPRELGASAWCRVIEQASDLGVLQVHFTGGEPLLRRDLELLVVAAREAELYVSLVTSGVSLSRDRLADLARAGLDHVQLSFQGTTAAEGVIFAGRDTFDQKLAVAGWTQELGVPLTLNFVLHRDNIAGVLSMVELGARVGAERVELANAQYLGWAFENRSWLLPSRDQLELARDAVRIARSRWPELTIDFVFPDYLAGRPRACMDGWARRYVVVAPDGRVLPCHAATVLPELEFENVEDAPLREIWERSPALRRFRDSSALSPICQTCPELERDHGGCRCQAFLLTGSARAVDPACERSPRHSLVQSVRQAERELVPLRLRKWAGRSSPAPRGKDS